MKIILDPISYFPIYFYIGYKGISVYGKNKAGPLKSLGAKFHCNVLRWVVKTTKINKSAHLTVKLRSKGFHGTGLIFPID